MFKFVLTFLIFLTCFSASIVFANELPANAKLNVYGNDWVCKHGFRKQGNECLAVTMPANAKLNVYGNDWVCKHGFRKQGNECLAVTMPANAKINVYGNDWVCKHGFRKQGNECLAVTMPANAKINVYGNDWVCKHGFRKQGNECLAVTMPANAKINVYGNDWVCKHGFRKQGNECLAVTMPANAKINVYGNDWVCKHGFRKQGNECLAVTMPANAKINVYGNDWVCKHGFRKQGNECLAVTMPANAKINVYGNDWVCKRGYFKQGDECQKVGVIAGEGEIPKPEVKTEPQIVVQKEIPAEVLRELEELRKENEFLKAPRPEVETEPQIVIKKETPAEVLGELERLRKENELLKTLKPAVVAEGKSQFPSESIDVSFKSIEKRPDDIAVIIGNADYEKQGKDIPNVNPAYADAEGMKQYFKQAKGIKEGNIIYFKDATAAQLLGTFGDANSHKGKLFNWLKPDVSNVYIYYAGHGVPGGEEGTAYLVPTDADSQTIQFSGYPLSTLYGNLGKLPAKSITVILEACFSGVSQAGNLFSKSSPIVIKPTKTMIPENVKVISAGAADQMASWEQDNSHGLFTKYFLKAMSGEGDKNNDGTVSDAELKTYLDETMTYYARRYYGRDQIVQIMRGK